MKKNLLLTTLLAAFSVAGFSQSLSSAASPLPVKTAAQRFSAVNAKSLQAVSAAKDVKIGKVIRKSAEDGVYYARPKGTLVAGMSPEGYSYYVNPIIVPPFYDVVYKNMSTNPATTQWSYDGEDVSEYADENGNLSWGNVSPYGCFPGQRESASGELYTPRYYAVPTLTSGSVSYQFGQSNEKYASNGPATIGQDTITSMNFLDECTADGYARGSLSTGYLLGSGSFTFSDGVGVCAGLLQLYPAPASPLWVKSITMFAYTGSEIVKDDGYIGMRIVETKPTEDGDYELTENVIAELVLTKDNLYDAVDYQSVSWSPTGQLKGSIATFQQYAQDDFGAVYVEPFTISTSFAIILTGLDSDKVDVDVLGYEEVAEDRQLPQVYALLDFDGDRGFYGVYRDLVLSFNFEACFDYCEAQTELYSYNQETGEIQDTFSNLNVIRVSADGKENHTEGADEDHDFGAAVFYTNFYWYDTDNFENYYALDVPEWISNVYGYDNVSEEYGAPYRTGKSYVQFECEPLPAGVTGRYAVLWFEGKGYKSAQPVYVLQGDATLEEAQATVINSVSKNTQQTVSGMFSVTGQRVNDSFKGIVLKNGKKFFNK